MGSELPRCEKRHHGKTRERRSGDRESSARDDTRLGEEPIDTNGAWEDDEDDEYFEKSAPSKGSRQSSNDDDDDAL